MLFNEDIQREYSISHMAKRLCGGMIKFEMFKKGLRGKRKMLWRANIPDVVKVEKGAFMSLLPLVLRGT